MDETPTETPLPALSGAARRRIAVTALCLVALLFGAWGLWRTWAPEPADAPESAGSGVSVGVSSMRSV